MKNHHLVTCPIFAKELAAVLPASTATPTVQLMDYRVHFNAEIMAREAARGVQAAGEEGAAISFLVGRECESLQPLSNIAESCGGRLSDGLNCIELLLGREKARALQENRSTVMTPAWIEMISKSIADGHWTVEDARINLGRYDRIILLDFGLEPLADELILAFFELTQVPIEILPVSLNHFRQVVARLLAPAV
ncbi:MAG: DUF1638 domain-containing protein [Desulfobulbaceae bacterium]|nr:DUF1638 domain-containing protein [Desulfobulbaceae bacterium]